MADHARSGSGKSHEEHALRLRTAGKRYVELDSLRGLAALTVIWYHFRLAFEANTAGKSGLKGLLVAPLFAGHQAVMLFFVLSGFVLAMPYASGKAGAYGVYLVRRFLRIYVPFFMALLLAWGCASYFVNWHLPLTPWYYRIWHVPLTGSLFLKQMLIPLSGSINTAFWSLRYEMEISIVFPLLCMFVLRFGTAAAGGLILALYAGAAALPAGGELSGTLQFAAIFVYGALLSIHRETLRRAYDRLPDAARALLFLIALALYYVGGRLDRWPRVDLGNAATGFAAGGLLVCALFSRRLSTALRHAVPEYLGRISYSLYLVHSTVLIVSLDLLYGKIAMPLLVLEYAAACLVTAHVFCLAVEEPAIRASKRLARASRRPPQALADAA